jgi:hypothetical protein
LVDLASPSIDAAVEVDCVVKAGASKKVDDHLTASAMMANDHQQLIRRKIVGTSRNLRHRGRAPGESADRLRLSLLSERRRPHPHAGRADARRIARDPGARRGARGRTHPREAEHALLTIIDAAGDFMESRPTLPAVWGAMRGAPELRALDLADTEGNAQILAPAIGALLPWAPAEDVEALALVIIEGVWSALQLGCELPPEKRPRVRAMLKEFVAAALAGLMEKYR